MSCKFRSIQNMYAKDITNQCDRKAPKTIEQGNNTYACDLLRFVVNRHLKIRK